MSKKAFDGLLDYSCSIPSGTVVGKKWKRRVNYYDESQGWMMGEYYAMSADEEQKWPGEIGIRWSKIEVIEEEATWPPRKQ